jgi:hypothetical protein
MTTTKRFSTGGGFPYEDSPGRTIEFTLSFGKSASQLLQASAADSSAPAAPLVPSDDANFSGGLLGRLMAVAGVDPLNPNQLAPPPQDDELRAFYRDDPTQPWTLQRWR